MPQQQDRRTQSSRTLIRRFWPYMRPYRKTLCVDLFCAALTTVCELVLPLLMRTITDTATNNLAALTVGLVLKLAGLYLVLRIIDAQNLMIEQRSVDSFICGFRLAWEMASELNHFEMNRHPSPVEEAEMDA